MNSFFKTCFLLTKKALVLFVLFIVASTSFAQTIYYANSVTGNDLNNGLTSSTARKTFTSVFAAAPSGSIIDLTGTFTWSDVGETTTTTSGFTINKSMTIRGQGADQTIIQANTLSNVANRRVFTINSGFTVVLEKLTIQNGKVANLDNSVYPADGGGIYNSGILSLNYCRITQNYAIAGSSYSGGAGGGIMHFANNTMTINGCTFDNNQSNNGGALANEFNNASGRFIIINSTFAYNKQLALVATVGGGAIWILNGTNIITNSTFAYNDLNNSNGSGTGQGASILVRQGNVKLKNSVFVNGTRSGQPLASGRSEISFSGGSATDEGNNIFGTQTGITFSSTSWVPSSGGDYQNSGDTTKKCQLSVEAVLQTNGATNGTISLKTIGLNIEKGSIIDNNGVSIPTIDQRGISRVGTPDIGAYEYTDLAPFVSCFSPSTGTAGTSITISGVNFTSAISVTIGGSEVQSFIVDSSAQITAIARNGSTSLISVTTSLGTGNSASNFTFVPTITTTGTLTAFTKCSGSASIVQSFSVSGSSLTAGISIAALAGFEYCLTSNGTYSPTLTVGAAGTIAPTTVFVRMQSAANNATYAAANIVLSSSGATNINVSASGTVSPTSVGGTIAGSGTVCTGSNSTTLTLSGYTGGITSWESSLDNFASAATTIANTTTTYTATNLSAITYFRAVVTNGSCAAANSASATVAVSPTSVAGSISGTATVCSGTNSTILTLSGNTGSVTRWESSLDNFSTAGTTIVNTTSTYTATNLSATTYYRAVVTSGSCAAANSASVTMAINVPAVVTNKTATVCSGGTFTVTPTTGSGNTVPSGTTYTWTVEDNTNVTGESTVTSSQSKISQTLTNTSTSNQNVVYTVTPKNTSAGSGYSVGSTFNGGVIAYIFKPGDNGYTPGKVLIVKNNFLPTGSCVSTGLNGWTMETATATTSAAIGEGLNNTNNLYNAGPTNTAKAIGYIYNYTDGIYSDWFAPSIDELTFAFNNVYSSLPTYSETQRAFRSSTEVPTNLGQTYAFKKNNANGYITADQNDGGCGMVLLSRYDVLPILPATCDGAPFTVTVTVISPSFAGSISGAATVCSGTNSTTLTLSGNTGSVTRWESSLDNFSTAATSIVNTTTSYTATNLSATTYYRAVVLNGSCTANSATATIYITNNNTWLGTTSSAWNTTSNWSCGLAPTATSNVIIASSSNQPIIDSNVSINSLTINTGTTLTVNSSFNLTVTNAVANSGTMTLQNNANLLQDTATTTNSNTGIITVKRDSASLLRLDHTLWSSPVESQNLYAFSPATLTNRFYIYDTSANAYATTGLSASTTFAAGKGYAVRAPNDHSSTTPTNWTGTFTGVPNNGSVPFTLSTTGSGFNLVGNPYPSPINASAFLTANSSLINGTLYFYAHSLTMDSNGIFPSGTNYCSWNGSAGTAATTAPLGDFHPIPVTPNGVIQVGQGFFVKATASVTINFTNAMRVGNNANQFLRTTEIERHRLWLNLATETGTDINQIAVAYVEGATQGADSNFDGLSFGNTGSSLSSKIDAADYVIQGRSLPFDSNDVVALGFKAATTGNYKIILTNKDGLFLGNQEVFVRDNLMGIEHNIKVAPYLFASQEGTFDGRFQLVYTQALGTPSSLFTPNSVLATKNSDGFIVTTTGIVMKDIFVYDIFGRLLFKQTNINGTSTVLKGLSQTKQVLLLKITSEENETVTVKVIN